MSDEFQVEEIIGRRINNGRVEYKIKWEGFPLSQSTWEPLKNLRNVISMVDEFDKKNKIKNEKKQEPKERSRSSSPENAKSKSTRDKQKSHGSKKSSDDNKDSDYRPNEDSEDEEENFEEEKSDINEELEEEKIEYIKVNSINKDFKAEVFAKKNGITEKITMTTAQLKKVKPEILIDFYESKIKFTSKKDFKQDI